MSCCDENQMLEIRFAKIDEPAPMFKLPAYDPVWDKELEVNLEEQKGKWSVLFFYPADFTFVCPTELKDMAEAKAEFDEMKVDVFAVSTDTVFSHRAWVKSEKLMENFPYTMIADHSLEVSDYYNLLDNKTWLAGRGTFVIDPNWVIRTIEVASWPLWRNSEELIRKIKALQFMEENPWLACPARWKKWNKTLKPSIKIVWKVWEELEK